MNEAHLHLLLNHLPVVGFLFATALITLSWWRTSEELRRVGLGFVALAGLSALPAYITGEPAEDVIEDLAGVPKNAIEKHEETAEGATVAAAVTGILAAGLLGLGIRRGKTPRWAVGVATVGSLVASTWLGFTANLGGRIRHPEIDGMPATGRPADDVSQRQ